MLIGVGAELRTGMGDRDQTVKLLASESEVEETAASFDTALSSSIEGDTSTIARISIISAVIVLLCKVLISRLEICLGNAGSRSSLDASRLNPLSTT